MFAGQPVAKRRGKRSPKGKGVKEEREESESGVLSQENYTRSLGAHPSLSFPSSSFSHSFSSSLMGPPVGTPAFLSASSLTKYERKKRENGGNGGGSGGGHAGHGLPVEEAISSLMYSTMLYGLNGQSAHTGHTAHGHTTHTGHTSGLSSSFYPSGLTPDLNNLHLPGIDGISPNDPSNFFSSPRAHTHNTGLTPGHQFFMFGSTSRTPSSAPFSAGVSEVDTADRRHKGVISGLKSGTYSSVRKHDRHHYYRTGLTPATNDNESPLKMSNDNTPLSDIGDISISSSVFSPSFSPSRAFGIPSGAERSERTKRNLSTSKSPRTEEALSLLADCIVERDQEVSLESYCLSVCLYMCVYLSICLSVRVFLLSPSYHSIS